MKIDFEKITEIIVKVENEYENLVNDGKSKKEIAIDLINVVVDVPIVGEGIEKHLIGFIIDAIVSAFNKIGYFKKA